MNKNDLEASEPIKADKSPDAARRRALIAGLATAPAIVTLFARPIWAQTASRVASAGICASLAAASSLHIGDTQLERDCDALSQPATEPSAVPTLTQ